ncbi:hypothetical protein SynPROS71_01268 [Synechococcus sp. PROS-7-1]|nr:hypothetical protein SynPROS71_01268 [Synechococcus sp. PROS-7-1]
MFCREIDSDTYAPCFPLVGSCIAFSPQASGFRLQASGFRLQASGFRLQASQHCQYEEQVVIFPILLHDPL